MTLSIASRNSPSTQSRHTISWLLLIIANILWASSYVAAKFALQETSVVLMLALRMVISALILLPMIIVRRKELKLTWKDLPQLIVLVLVGFVINKLLEFGGLALTTASDVALLITGESIFTAAWAWILLHEPFKKKTAIALLIGFLGVYLIVERSLWPNLPTGGGAGRMIGDLLVVVALLIESFYTIQGKALLVKHSPLLITAASIVGSVVFWLPVAGWELFTRGLQPISLMTWLSIGWLALMATVIAYLAWFKGLMQIDGTRADSTLFIQPLLGTFLAVVLLQDQLSPLTIIGGLLIVASVYLISR
jgi:drug/metabolite transporter (DMT)-like permease